MPLPSFLQKFMCCKSCKSDDVTDELTGVDGIADKAKDAVSSTWAQEVLDKSITAQNIVQKAVIASFPKGEIKAKNFDINEQGLANIIKALEGDTSVIAEEGIVLGDGHPRYVPGKIQEGTAIFATAVAGDGDEPATGGCVVFKTLNHVLVCTFEKDLEAASGFVEKIANGIKDKGL